MIAPVRFEALGSVWSFRFGWAAVIGLEREFDLPFLRILQRAIPAIAVADLLESDPAELQERLIAAAGEMRWGDVATVFRHGLAIEQPEVTEAKVLEIAEAIGMNQVLSIIAAAAHNDTGGSEGAENPPTESPSESTRTSC